MKYQGFEIFKKNKKNYYNRIYKEDIEKKKKKNKYKILIIYKNKKYK